jgi:hypothetical protein
MRRGWTEEAENLAGIGPGSGDEELGLALANYVGLDLRDGIL